MFQLSALEKMIFCVNTLIKRQVFFLQISDLW